MVLGLFGSGFKKLQYHHLVKEYRKYLPEGEKPNSSALVRQAKLDTEVINDVIEKELEKLKEQGKTGAIQTKAREEVKKLIRNGELWMRITYKRPFDSPDLYKLI
jgi:hypothetical protein